MNKITIHGRLGQDPELVTRQGAQGDFQVCNFSVATRRAYGDETDWFYCQAMGKQAEVAAKFLKKGSEVIIYGEMQSRKVDDKTFWQCRINQFEFCGNKAEKDENKPNGSKSFDEMEEVSDDDIPF